MKKKKKLTDDRAKDLIIDEFIGCLERLEETDGIEKDYSAYIMFSLAAAGLRKFLGIKKFTDLMKETSQRLK